MTRHLLDYALPSEDARRNHWPLRFAALAAAASGAAVGAGNAYAGASRWAGSLSCASGRGDATARLLFLAPGGIVLCLIGWRIASRVNSCVTICRLAFWSTLAAWCASVAVLFL